LVRNVAPISADQIVAELNAAGTKRAVVLSVAYWFGDPRREGLEDEYAKVRAENDWTVQQASRFADRLIPFCSVNPLKSYALEEIARCTERLRAKGLKLHFNSSGVDIRVPEQREKVRQVFRAANQFRLPVVVHVRGDLDVYGREHADIFLKDILTAAPDVTVQIAHLWGGEAFADSALAVYAAAVSAGKPETNNLYFDVADIARWVARSGPRRQIAADRMRQIGLHRILWGSDMSPPAAREAWTTFGATLPLTAEEIGIIASNVAPYLP